MSSFEHFEEKAILISRKEGSSLCFDLKKLQAVLCNQDVADKKVAVISVIGESRTGKSFLLNYMLRFLRANRTSNWFGRPSERLDGFQWSSESTREVTEGVWIWNRLFPIEQTNGEEVYVMLVDSQGSKGNLLVVIRDWEHRDIFPYGYSGGFQYWKHFESKLKSSEALAAIHRFRSAYNVMRCYPLPSIGGAVDRLEMYDGRNSKMSNNFIENYKELITSMFDEQLLCVKKLLNVDLTCGELYKYCERVNYVVKRTGKIDLQSIGRKSICDYSSNKVEEYTQYYDQLMKERLKLEVTSLEDLDALHAELKDEGIKKLTGSKGQSVGALLKGQCELLIRGLDASYLFIRKDCKEVIAKKKRLHDVGVSKRVYNEFKEEVERDQQSINSQENLLDFLSQARDNALTRLRVGLLSFGGFRRKVLDTMEANFAAYGNRVYVQHPSTWSVKRMGFYEIWRDRNNQKMHPAYDPEKEDDQIAKFRGRNTP